MSAPSPIDPQATHLAVEDLEKLKELSQHLCGNKWHCVQAPHVAGKHLHKQQQHANGSVPLAVHVNLLQHRARLHGMSGPRVCS